LVVETGLDRVRRERPKWLTEARILLVTNGNSCDSQLKSSIEVLKPLSKELKGVVVPEHGLYSSRREGEEIQDSMDQELGVRVLSWYSGDRNFRASWMEGVDLVVYDVQDGGVRFHTYLSTLKSALEACSRAGVRLIVLDRPNPIRGDVIQGNIPTSLSIVCPWRIPIRHGLTPGEFASLVNAEANLNCDLSVVEMRGWRRSAWFDETGLPWVQLSPNTPTLTTSTLYPGTCLFEGTTLSVGRGTTKPFELIGAPWLKARDLAEDFDSLGLTGVKARYTRFLPWYSKYAGQECRGVQLHVLDRDSLDPVKVALYLLRVVLKLHSREEVFGERREHFDLLMGESKTRKLMEEGSDPEPIMREWEVQLNQYRERVEEHLIYR